jgi:hypothetical protein
LAGVPALHSQRVKLQSPFTAFASEQFSVAQLGFVQDQVYSVAPSTLLVLE